MQLALEEALKGKTNTYPNPRVGAIVVANKEVVSSGYHHHYGGPHAEAVAISKLKGTYTDATLFVTLEPCAMCFGAMIHARIERVVFGTSDPKTGVCGSCIDLNKENFFNHKISVKGGVLDIECSKLLKLFFKSKRNIK